MRANALVARLWVLGSSFVAANYDSRGPEVEFFYRAYRMDVDISVAEFLANPENEGKDPNVEKPWQLGRNLKTQNDDLDWPKGGRPHPFYGLNFHAWMAGVDAQGKYGRAAARSRIDDPVDPDFKAAFGDEKDANGNYVEPRKNIMRLPPNDGRALDPIRPDNSFAKPRSLNKFSFTAFNPNEIFGGLNKATKGMNPGNYFEFDNMLGIVAKRCSDLYEKNPAVGKAHYQAMTDALRNAEEGRRMESRKFQVEGAYKVLEKYETSKHLKEGTISRQKNILKTKTKVEPTTKSGSWYPGWKSEKLDLSATKKSWPKSLAQHKEAIFGKPKSISKGVMVEFVEKWTKGDLSFVETVQDRDSGGQKDVRVTDPGMGSSHSHLQVMNAEKALNEKILAQIDEPTLSARALGCDWFTTRDPNEGGLPDPHTKRMVLTILEEARTQV